MRKAITLTSILAAILALALLVLMLSGDPAYDLKAYILGLWRLTLWFVAVIAFYRLKPLIEDDDLEQDWDRINSGNVAVAVYRAGEFLVIGGAAALLIAQV